MEAVSILEKKKPREVRLHEVGLRYPGLFRVYEADQLVYMLLKLWQEQNSWEAITWKQIIGCQLLSQMKLYSGGEVKQTLLGLEQSGYLFVAKTGRYNNQIKSVQPTDKLIELLVANGY